MYNKPYTGTNEYSPAYWSQWCPGRNQVAVKNKLPFTRTYPLIMIQYKYALARYKRCGRTWHAAQSVNVIVKRLRAHGVKLPKVKPSLDSLKDALFYDLEEAGYNPKIDLPREHVADLLGYLTEWTPDYLWCEGATSVFYDASYHFNNLKRYEDAIMAILIEYIGD